MMDAATVARATWAHASTHGTEPRVFELAPCDCVWPEGRHDGHIVATYRPVAVSHLVATLGDLCCQTGTEALAVWTEITQPESAQLLLVVADGSAPVALWGPIGSEPQIREAVAGQLYAACLAALTPVPADDPLVVELAAIAGGGS